MKPLVAAVALLAACAAPPAKTLSERKEQAPDFTLVDTDGKQVALHDFLARGPVLLAFFPKAFTAGCTSEMKAFRDKYAAVRAKGAEVIAISTDDVPTLKRFRDSLGAPFPFLSDPAGEVAARYAGVSGRTTNRVTVSIDTDGKIVHVSNGLGAIFPDDDIKACPRGAGAAPSNDSI